MCALSPAVFATASRVFPFQGPSHLQRCPHFLRVLSRSWRLIWLLLSAPGGRSRFRLCAVLQGIPLCAPVPKQTLQFLSTLALLLVFHSSRALPSIRVRCRQYCYQGPSPLLYLRCPSGFCTLPCVGLPVNGTFRSCPFLLCRSWTSAILVSCETLRKEPVSVPVLRRFRDLYPPGF